MVASLVLLELLRHLHRETELLPECQTANHASDPSWELFEGIAMSWVLRVPEFDVGRP